MGTIRPTLSVVRTGGDDQAYSIKGQEGGDDQAYSIRGQDRWGQSGLLYQRSGQVGTIRPTLSEVTTGGDDQTYSISGQDMWGQSGLLYQRSGQVGTIRHTLSPEAKTGGNDQADSISRGQDRWESTMSDHLHQQISQLLGMHGCTYWAHIIELS